jgi:hypothetical protein
MWASGSTVTVLGAGLATSSSLRESEPVSGPGPGRRRGCAARWLGAGACQWYREALGRHLSGLSGVPYRVIRDTGSLRPDHAAGFKGVGPAATARPRPGPVTGSDSRGPPALSGPIHDHAALPPRPRRGGIRRVGGPSWHHDSSWRGPGPGPPRLTRTRLSPAASVGLCGKPEPTH